MTLIIKWLINAGVIFLVSRFLPGIHIPDFTTALWAAFALGVLNALIRPILRILTFPITLMTLGLFTFVLNGFMFYIATKLVSDFTVDNFWWAMLGALIVSLVSALGSHLILGSDGKLGDHAS